mgnify:FL=1
MPAVILPKGTGVEGKAKAIARNEEQLAGPCFNITTPTDTTEAFGMVEVLAKGEMQWCLIISYSDINDYRTCFTQAEQDEMIGYDSVKQAVI